MKKILICLVLLTTTVNPAWALIDTLFTVGKFIWDQVQEISEQFYRRSMIENSLASLAKIKKTYDDSMRFYNDMRYIYSKIKQWQETPAAFREDIILPTERRFRELTLDRALWEIESRAAQMEGPFERRERQIIEYVQKNWKFAELFKKHLEARTTQHQEIVNKLQEASDKLKKAGDNQEQREDAISEIKGCEKALENLQTGAILDIGKLMLKQIEIQNKILEEQEREKRFLRQQQEAYMKLINDIVKSRYQTAKKKQKLTPAEVLKEGILK